VSSSALAPVLKAREEAATSYRLTKMKDVALGIEAQRARFERKPAT